MKIDHLQPRFVESIPPGVEEGYLYISIRFRTAIHRCCCGCGTEVTTPIRPSDWTLTYDGETISLSPSIGNWSLPCRSHYWIMRGEVIEAPQWSQERIAANRIFDLRRKGALADGPPTTSRAPELRFGLWARIVRIVRALLRIGSR